MTAQHLSVAFSVGNFLTSHGSLSGPPQQFWGIQAWGHCIWSGESQPMCWNHFPLISARLSAADPKARPSHLRPTSEPRSNHVRTTSETMAKVKGKVVSSSPMGDYFPKGPNHAENTIPNSEVLLRPSCTDTTFLDFAGTFPLKEGVTAW